jgi:hypothetical protein
LTCRSRWRAATSAARCCRSGSSISPALVEVDQTAAFGIGGVDLAVQAGEFGAQQLVVGNRCGERDRMFTGQQQIGLGERGARGAGVFTQARRLEGPSGVEAMVRDALAVMLEVPRDQIEVEVRPQLPEDLAEAVARVRQARVDAEARPAAATEAAADLARRLTGAGMSVRDAGVVMGVSAQRVSQLVHHFDTDGRRAAS